ncbi:hypothetical protein SDC9_125970 [bioreactor metagenome]|uniref:Ribosomal-processing cysteine protease Prp n=1 Tax=bioreactor metagenome TaxID=1076179 RepID=A0A645CPX8_9ZZZZ|nr:ribosomal-processing cysteine protease Prp [Oscillospiraceae bacterium]
MITATFRHYGDGKIRGFELRGHSGLAEAGADILCAAVSAMAMLVINTSTGIFGAAAETKQDETIPLLIFALAAPAENEAVYGVLTGFYDQLRALSEDHPKNLRVKSDI